MAARRRGSNRRRGGKPRASGSSITGLMLGLVVLVFAYNAISQGTLALPHPPGGAESTRAADGSSSAPTSSAGYDTARSELARLAVREPTNADTYSRDAFGTPWADVDHNGCSTRDDVLARDLSAATVKSDGCTVLSGTLNDPYTGTTITFRRGRTTSSQVQIDHVTSLGDAWRTGAASWTDAQRLAFANDPANLLAVDGATNEAKSDQDAASWLPPNPAFDCRYVATQVAIKTTYQLWVTPAEHDAMADTLSHC